MGDTIALPWAQQQEDAPDLTASALEGIKAGQAMGAANAFHNLNPSDPASVDTALSGLIHNGALDQASALQNLNWAKFQRAGIQSSIGRLHTILNPDAPPPGAPSSAGPSQPPTANTDQPTPSDQPPPDPVQARRELASWASLHLEALAGIKDPQVQRSLRLLLPLRPLSLWQPRRPLPAL